eukprot:scaffold25560_cov60-Attheya_sp.AAC.1
MEIFYELPAAPQANRVPISLGDQTGRYQLFSTDPCGSLWFERFMSGMKYRMGQDWHPHYAMSLELLHAVIVMLQSCVPKMLQAIEKGIGGLFSTVFTAIVVVKEEMSTLVIALLGKIKGEHHDFAHLLPCIHVTSSGIKVKQAIDDLMIEIKEKHGFRDGPAISDSAGRVHKIRDINDCLHEILDDLFDNGVNLTCSQSMLGIRRSYTRHIKLSEPFGKHLTPVPFK